MHSNKTLQDKEMDRIFNAVFRLAYFSNQLLLRADFRGVFIQVTILQLIINYQSRKTVTYSQICGSYMKPMIDNVFTIFL